MSARAREIHVPAEDGLPLTGTLHEPPDSPGRRTVILSSAVGVPRGFYGSFAEYLADHGSRVITYDYRGMGGSPAPEAGWPTIRMQDWGELDMAGVIAWATGRWEDPLVMVGHSAGGQLFGLCHNASRVRGMLGVAVQSGYWRNWPLPHRWIVGLLWYLAIPCLVPLTGRLPGRASGLGADLPPAMARQWAAWGRDPDYLRGDRAPASARHFDGYEGPLLAVALTDDRLFAPPSAVRAYLEFWPRARTDYRELSPREVGVPEIGHFGFFRPEPGGRLWAPAREWLEGL